MQSLRITSLAVLFSATATTSALSGNLADKLIQYHQRACLEQDYIGSDLRLEDKYPSPSKIDVSVESYYRLDVFGQQTFAEVVMLEGGCGSDETGYCGSAGCKGYIIFEDVLVFEFLGGRPFTAANPNANSFGNFIIFPKALGECQEHVVPGSRSPSDSGCYDLVYWDGTTVTAHGSLRQILAPLND